MTCPNINHKDFKELMNKIGVVNAYKLWIENGEGYINPRQIQSNNYMNVDNSINNYKTTKDASSITQHILPFKFTGINNPVTVMGTYDTVSNDFNGEVTVPLATLEIDEKYNLNISVNDSKLKDYLTQEEVINKLVRDNFITNEAFNPFPISHVRFNNKLIVLNKQGYYMSSNVIPRYFDTDLIIEKYTEQQIKEQYQNQDGVDIIAGNEQGIQLGNLTFYESNINVKTKELNTSINVNQLVKSKMIELSKSMGFKDFMRVLSITSSDSGLKNILNQSEKIEDVINYISNKIINGEEVDKIFNPIKTEYDKLNTLPESITLNAKPTTPEGNRLNEKLNEHQSKLSFIDENTEEYNSYTKLYNKQHKYVKRDTNEVLSYSSTSLLHNFDEFLFDDNQFIFDRGIALHPKLKDHFAVLIDGNINNEASNKKKERFIEAVHRNNINYFYDAYPISSVLPLPHETTITIANANTLNEEGDFDINVVHYDYNKPDEKEEFLKEYRKRFKYEFEKEFIRITEMKEKHSRSSVIGTDLHMLQEAILTDEDERTHKQKAAVEILEKINNEVLLEEQFYKSEAFYNELVQELEAKTKLFNDKVKELESETIKLYNSISGNFDLSIDEEGPLRALNHRYLIDKHFLNKIAFFKILNPNVKTINQPNIYKNQKELNALYEEIHNFLKQSKPEIKSLFLYINRLIEQLRKEADEEGNFERSIIAQDINDLIELRDIKLPSWLFENSEDSTLKNNLNVFSKIETLKNEVEELKTEETLNFDHDLQVLTEAKNKNFYNENLYGTRREGGKTIKYDSIVAAKILQNKQKSYKYAHYVEFYRNFKSFKEQVVNNGGIIYTEFKLLIEDVNVEPGVKSDIGGQIDILVVYPKDDARTPEHLRGKGQIYDIKTINSTSTTEEINKFKNFTGIPSSSIYTPQKQQKHATQLYIYKEGIERQLGIEIESIAVIPILVPYADKTKSRKDLELKRNEAVKQATDKLNKNEITKSEYETNLAIIEKEFVNEVNKLSETNNFGNGSYLPGTLIFGKNLIKSSSNLAPFAINIKDFGINSIVAQQKASSFFDQKDFRTEEQRDFDESQKIEQEKQYVVELQQLVDNLKIHISSKITSLRQALSKDPEETNKRKKELQQLQQDLSTLENVKVLAYFIEAANKELNGDVGLKRKGYIDRMNELLFKNKATNELNDHELLKELDNIKSVAEGYNILDNLKRMIDNNADKTDLSIIVKSELYHDLEQAIKAKNKLQDMYHSNIAEIMASKLASYASKNADRMLNEIEETTRERIEDDIKFFQKKIDEKVDVEHYTKMLEKSKFALEKLAEKIQAMDFSKEALRQEFEQASRDISYADLMFYGGLNTNDKVLALFAKMIKFQLYDAEVKLKQLALQMQKALDKLEKSKKLNHNNSDKTYEPVLETLTLTQWNPITEEYETKNVTRIISEVGVKEYTLLDGTKGVFTHEEIIKDFNKHIGEAYNNGNLERFAELKNQFDKWKDENLERQYIDSYYDWKNSLPEKAKKALDDINNEIKEIRDAALNDTSDEFPTGRNTFFLNKQERKRLNELYHQRRQLSNKFNEITGELKEGEELEIAEALSKYNEQFREFHEFEENNDLFEMNRMKAERLYGADSIKYKEWIEDNTVLTLTDKFWEDYNKIRLKRQLLFFASHVSSIFTGNPYLISDSLKEIIFEKLPAYNSQEHGDSIDDYVITLLEDISDDNINYEAEYQVYLLTTNNKTDANLKLSNILKAYSEKGVVNGLLMTDDVLFTIKELQEQIQFEYHQLIEELKQLGQSNKNSTKRLQQIEFMNMKKIIYEEANSLYYYSPTQHYFDKVSEYEEQIAIAQSKYDTLKKELDVLTTSNDLTTEQQERLNIIFDEVDAAKENLEIQESLYSFWISENHIEDDEGNRTPTRAWTQIAPTSTVNKFEPTSKYEEDKKQQLDSLKKKFPRLGKVELERELKKTTWYKQNHDNVTGKITKRTYLQQVPDSYYSTRQPNSMYSKINIKDSVKRPREQVYDKLGNHKPLLYERGYEGVSGKELWLNKNYNSLKANREWFEFRNAIQEIYNEVQLLLPASYRRGGIIPQIPKERLVEIFATTPGSVKDKAKAVINKIKNSSFITSEQEDIQDKKQSEVDIKSRFVPVHYINQLEDSEVSKDIVNTILVFAGMATRHNALSDVLAETRALLSIIEKRESESGKGTVMRDSLGNAIKDGNASKIGIEKDARIEGETRAMRKTREFIKMQIFEEMNKPFEFSLFGKNLRGDKLLDGVMGITSFLQIGGATAILWGSTGAWTKGVTNALNANTQVFIEAAAGEFFTTGAWRKALYKYTLGLRTDLAKDINKITNVSFLGQMIDLFDPLVGEFKDKTGRTIPRSHFQKLFTSDLWFMNQYAGEHQTATTMMIAYLESIKVIEGEVYTLEEYLESKRKDLNRKLTRAEKTKFAEDFHKIKESLYNSFEVNKETGELKIKEGVNYDINSDRHKQVKLRLQGIGKKLQGAYSQFDKTLLQQTSMGRALMMYKKYLAPAVARRFQSMNRSEELGTINEGYYRTFIGRIAQDVINLYAMATGKRRQSDKRDSFIIPKMLLRSIPYIGKKIELKDNEDTMKLTDVEYNNIKKALRELGTIILLAIAVAILAPEDDEDKNQISAGRWFALYQLERLRKELNALTFVHPKAWEDNWKLIKNPIAGTGFVDKLVKFMMQFSDPTAVYEKRSGAHEKGDSKLTAKFIALLQSITKNNLFMDSGKMDRVLRQDYDNLNRSF